MMMEMSRAYQHSLLDEVSEGVVPAAIDEVAELPATAHVAVQGVEGAYQHIACRELFVDPDIVFVPTFDAVADAVEEGRVEYGILPLENSTAGTVDRVYDLLYKRGLYIARAITLRINHDLLAKPGVEESDIVEVFSHEQALRQCTDFIAQMPNEVTSDRLPQHGDGGVLCGEQRATRCRGDFFDCLRRALRAQCSSACHPRRSR